MKFSAHLPFQGSVNQLVLAHAGQAGEGGRDDAGSIVVAIAGQILDNDSRIRKRSGEIGLELGGGYGHGQAPLAGILDHQPGRTSMKRILALSGLGLLLGACNVVVTKEPLLTAADEAGAPPMRPGVWRMEGLDQPCQVDESRPLIEWPKCAGGVVIKQGAVGFYDRDGETPAWTSQAFVLAAGMPRIGQAQAKISGDVKVGSDPFIYFGAQPTKNDAVGRITAMSIWPVQCGPPPPGDKAESTAHPLPGIEMNPGDPVCTTSSVAVLRAAAKASEPWVPKTVHARWVRDGGP